MTNPLSYPNRSIPTNYSGVTINITNPMVNTAPQNGCQQPQQAGIYAIPQDNYYAPVQDGTYAIPLNNYSQQIDVQDQAKATNSTQNEIQQLSERTNTVDTRPYRETAYAQNTIENSAIKPDVMNAYPPQYYLNNYIQNSEQKNDTIPANTKTEEISKSDMSANNIDTQEEQNMDTSKEIINELDSRNAEQKELEKNGKKTRVVALTNEYIMSLENYLNNPNTEIRLMASKEVLTRLDEDKSRYDDAALNALLNKMLQDPEKLIRIAALSAFSSQLASGNDYTETLLKQIQQNPNADKEDVLEASEILLKRSASTEIKYTPTTEQKQETQKGND